MFRLLQYYSRFESIRGDFGGLPSWARFIVFVFALPGLVLVGLSILALLASIAALLLLTVPVYRLLKLLVGRDAPNTQPESPVAAPPPSGRRHVDVRIVE